MADSISRKTVMQIGIVVSTFFTLLIPLTQTGAQLIIIRILTGIGAGFCVFGAVPDRASPGCASQFGARLKLAR